MGWGRCLKKPSCGGGHSVMLDNELAFPIVLRVRRLGGSGDGPAGVAAGQAEVEQAA